MLRISKLTDYGTLVLSQLAAEPHRMLSASELAGRLRLAQPTVSKVLKTLARHGLVRAERGARGGYALSRAAGEISLAQIVDALEEQPFGLTECSANNGLCDFEANCRVRVNWQRVNATLRRSLQAVTLADMVQPVGSPVGHEVSRNGTVFPSQAAITWSSGK